MTYPTVSNDPSIQGHYEDCRRAGTAHGLAEMFALGQPPMSNSDREFLEATENGRQFQGNEFAGNFYRQEAAKAGVNTTGKVYKAGLAAFPGDPEAWVSGRGDVQRLVEKRGWECSGSVNVRMREKPPAPEIDVADDILEAEVEKIEDLAGPVADRGELKEKVRQKRKPHWSK